MFSFHFEYFVKYVNILHPANISFKLYSHLGKFRQLSTFWLEFIKNTGVFDDLIFLHSKGFAGR